MAVVARWSTADPQGDVNGDGTVDIADVQQVAGAWRQTCHVPAEVVKYYALGGERVAMRRAPVGQAGTLYYLFADHLGSTSVAYNTATGQVQAIRYYPWGSIRSGDVPTDRRWGGGCSRTPCPPCRGAVPPERGDGGCRSRGTRRR